MLASDECGVMVHSLKVFLCLQFGFVQMQASILAATIDLIFFGASGLMALVGFYLCYAVSLATSCWLTEMGAYELPTAVPNAVVLWYMFTVGCMHIRRFLLFTCTSKIESSLECCFRNARWLEREVGEMLNVWFKGKRDRRALFLVPLLYWGVLRRYFPAGGFFEVRLWGSEGRIAIFHITWLD